MTDLKPKDREIIEKLSQGMSFKQVSTEINLPVKTIEHRILKIRKKENCLNTAHLINKFTISVIFTKLQGSLNR